MLVRAFRLLLISCVLLCSTAAHAQSAPSAADKATARQLAIEGHEALKAKDYEKAADFYERAEKLYHAPTLLVGLARAYTGLGKFVEASEAYNRVLRETLGGDASDAFRRAQEDAKAEIDNVTSKIAHATISVDGPESPKVLLDGEPLDNASLGVKRPVNPGDHKVEASAAGFVSQDRRFSVESGELTEVSFELLPAPEAAQPTEGLRPISIAGFAALGLGVAGLAVGGVTGGMAMGRHGELTDACPGNVCAADQGDNLDSYRTLGTVSTAGFVAGGVFAAVGATLVILGSGSDEPATSFDARGLRVHF